MQVWIGRNGERFGPYGEDEVRQWLRDGTCRPEELGWYEGMTDWRPLGELFPDERPASGAVPPPPPPFMGVHETAEPEYAGFWLRFGAWVIDYLILMVPFTAISLSMGLGAAMTRLFAEMEKDQTAAITAYAATAQPITYVLLVIGFVYYAFFESSKWQATPGKMAVGIRVTDTEGRRISVGRAAGRNAVRLLNAFTLLVPMVFYVVAAFTQRKQGVHDLLASTYVLVGRADKVASPAPRGRTGGSFDA
ncbi:RDD family protein [Luteibacter flocculans]|uniref:RDD family protein n=1 Tax=Luteibacter flocculans TaxID=2780091 RepID=A0ABY4T2A3_9GAMM|nr:RDD family protein [Luteibacter flocculans]URL58746.1 RDD family protein [Luteibacter flocculans]